MMGNLFTNIPIISVIASVILWGTHGADVTTLVVLISGPQGSEDPFNTLRQGFQQSDRRVDAIIVDIDEANSYAITQSWCRNVRNLNATCMILHSSVGYHPCAVCDLIQSFDTIGIFTNKVGYDDKNVISPNYNNYIDMLADIMVGPNASVETTITIYDETGAELAAAINRHSGSLEILHLAIFYDNSMSFEMNDTLRSTVMDAKHFIVIASSKTIEDIFTQAMSVKLIDEFHHFLVLTTDEQLPSCDHCFTSDIYIISDSSVNATCDSVTALLIKSAVGVMNISKARESCEPVDVCCSFGNVSNAKISKVLSSSFEQCQKIACNDDRTEREGELNIYQYKMLQGNYPIKVGSWKNGVGLKMNGTYRRTNWTKKRMRIITVHEPPLVFRNVTNGVVSYHGYCIDVLNELASRLDFTYAIRECEGGVYGNLADDKKWTGCIGEIVRGSADMVVGALSVTAERESVVDFTSPYYDLAGIQILYKKLQSEFTLMYFTKVFSTEAWICLFAVVAATSIMLVAFDRFSPSRNRNKLASHEEDKSYDLKESMWFVLGSLTMSGSGESPRCFPARILVAGFWFFCTIMMSTFTANLAAFLTVSRLTETMSSLHDLASQSSVNFSVVGGSSSMMYFQRMADIENNFYTLWKEMSFGRVSVNLSQEGLAVWDYPLGDTYVNIWNRIQDTGLLNSTEQGIEKVLNENFALLTDSPIVKYETTKHCELLALGDQFSSRSYAFALKDNSVLIADISSEILKLQQERYMETLKTTWWNTNKATCPNVDANIGLDLETLRGNFIVIGGGLVFGVLFLLAEILWFTVKNKEKDDVMKSPGPQDLHVKKYSHNISNITVTLPDFPKNQPLSPT